MATCAGCNANLGDYGYIGYHGRTWCMTCYDSERRNEKATKKAELDAEPRCQVPGCSRRGTWHIGPHCILMCGWCYKRVQRAHARNIAGLGCRAFYALFGGIDYSDGDYLAMARSAEN